MNTESSITYIPRSDDELKTLTNRLRSELDEHYSFAPKANARLEEVVLGTLGMPNGRQQWQNLVSNKAKTDSDFSMSLFINVSEESETDTNSEVSYLELVLDDKLVNQIEKVALAAKGLNIDCELRDLPIKDSPFEGVSGTISNTGFFDVHFEKRVKKAWPITVGQTSDLHVNQILEAYRIAKDEKASLSGFLPRYSEVLYLLKDEIKDGELSDRVDESISTWDEIEASEFFSNVAAYQLALVHGEVIDIPSIDDEQRSGLSGIKEFLNFYHIWLVNQPFFKEMNISDQYSASDRVKALGIAVAKADFPLIMERYNELMKSSRYGFEWGVKPDELIEVQIRIQKYKESQTD